MFFYGVQNNVSVPTRLWEAPSTLPARKVITYVQVSEHNMRTSRPAMNHIELKTILSQEKKKKVIQPVPISSHVRTVGFFFLACLPSLTRGHTSPRKSPPPQASPSPPAMSPDPKTHTVAVNTAQSQMRMDERPSSRREGPPWRLFVSSRRQKLKKWSRDASID